MSNRLSVTQIVTLIDKIEPWRSDTAYSRDGWRNLIETARVLQRCDTNTFRRALVEFVQTNRQGNFKSNYEEESKPFLLLRIMFDLPEGATFSERFSFKGWLRLDRERGTFAADVNSDGTVNLAWPIKWNRGHPVLVQGWVGSKGGPYAVGEEFDYMLRHFEMRDLDKRSE